MLSFLTQESHHPRPSTTLAQTEKHSDGVDLFRTRGCSNKSSKHSPGNFKAGEPEAWADVREDDLRWDQHDAIADIEIGGETRQKSSFS